MKLTYILLVLSIFISLFGSCYKDLENFVEYEKTGTVPLNDLDTTIIYLKYEDVEDKEAMNNSWHYRHLALKKLSEESEELIIYKASKDKGLHEGVYVDKNNQRLYYIIWERGFGNHYLYVFDLNSKEEAAGKILLERNILRRDDIRKYISNEKYIKKLIEDSFKQDIVIYTKYYGLDIPTDTSVGLTNIGYYDLPVDIPAEITEKISREELREALFLINFSEESSIYVSENSVKKLFWLPCLDGIYYNINAPEVKYKKKYNGVYINDGFNNIRIAKYNKNYYLAGPAFWIERGQYVIVEDLLFDTSGKLEEQKVVAYGRVLAVY